MVEVLVLQQIQALMVAPWSASKLVVVVVHVVPILHVVVILLSVHQLIQDQVQVIQTFFFQILFVLSQEMVSVLKMEISLNFGSLPKPDPVLKNTTLHLLQSTGWDKTNVLLKASTEKQLITHQEKLRFPKQPST
jgi:hypothetical protein